MQQIKAAVSEVTKKAVENSLQPRYPVKCVYNLTIFPLRRSAFSSLTNQMEQANVVLDVTKAAIRMKIQHAKEKSGL